MPAPERPRAADPDLELLELDLDLARNWHGPLDADARGRLVAVWRDPTERTWEAAHSLILNPDRGGMGLTLWLAVLAVDPAYRQARAPTWRWDEARQRSYRTSGWSRVPDQATIRAAVHHAVHPAPRPT